MRDIVKAMAEEKLYATDRMKDIDTSLIERLKQYGYNNLKDYFSDKTAYLFREWIPEVHYIDADFLTNGMEKAIANEEYGIYILVPEKLYAFHGNDDIDYELCEALGVRVIEMHYHGGTIIGSSDDLGILLVIPLEMNISSSWIMDNIFDIISSDVDNAVIAGNDIMIDGEKVMGSMTRTVGNAFVWAAQISFGEYGNVIDRVCKKASGKKPGKIQTPKLTKDKLEREVLKWLRKRSY